MFQDIGSTLDKVSRNTPFLNIEGGFLVVSTFLWDTTSQAVKFVFSWKRNVVWVLFRQKTKYYNNRDFSVELQKRRLIRSPEHSSRRCRGGQDI